MACVKNSVYDVHKLRFLLVTMSVNRNCSKTFNKELPESKFAQINIFNGLDASTRSQMDRRTLYSRRILIFIKRMPERSVVYSNLEYTNV
jgi:hypothetical protein